MQRHPEGDGAAGLAEVPGQRRRVPEHQRSARRARTPRPGPRLTAAGQAPARRAVCVQPTRTGTGMSRPRPLGRQQAVDRAAERRRRRRSRTPCRSARRPEPPAGDDRDGRGADAGLALAGSSTAVEGAAHTGPPGGDEPGASGQVEVTRHAGPAGRGRKQGELRPAVRVVVLDDQRAARAQQPGRSVDRPSRMTASPSGPANSAAAGSWRAPRSPTTLPSGR